ncbi:MAG: hypothetical protein KDD64_16985 [Bdellovibrionales bacterium]|nr:hypothetical protein [Bdellovibrionales bacterium]
MVSRNSLPAVLVASSALLTGGCDLEHSTLSSKTVERISDHTSVYTKLVDGSLLCTIQRDDHLFFFKNASGYGEAGAELSLVVVGGGVDWSTANGYFEVSHLEALAYVGNNWETIYNAARLQLERDSYSVDPNLVRYWLEPLTKPMQEVGERWLELQEPAPSMDQYFRGETPKLWVNQYMQHYFPVHIPLEDGSLLRISQAPHYMYYSGDSLVPHEDLNVKIIFSRNFPGYGVAGIKGHVVGIGGGAEYPIGGKYFEITPQEAVSYMDGDWEAIVRAVERQHETLIFSPDTDYVRAAVHPRRP